MKSVTYRAVVAALAFISCAVNAQAIGRVSMAQGECELQRGSQMLSITQGALVSPHDALFTRGNGRMEWVLRDDSYIALVPNSGFQIERYEFNPDGSGHASFRLLDGGFRLKTGALAQSNPQMFQVRTPLGAISPRGTDFSVAWCDTNCALSSGVAEGLYISVFEGAVQVTSDSTISVVDAGQHAALYGLGEPVVLLPEAPQIEVGATAGIQFSGAGVSAQFAAEAEAATPRIEPEEPASPS